MNTTIAATNVLSAALRVLLYEYCIYLIKYNGITLVPKINAATIQTRLPLGSCERCLSHDFHNQLCVVIIKGAAFNQVNAILLLLLH